MRFTIFIHLFGNLVFSKWTTKAGFKVNIYFSYSDCVFRERLQSCKRGLFLETRQRHLRFKSAFGSVSYSVFCNDTI